MSLDLGSPAIEIAIGLSFVFFLLSLIVTALTEGVAGLFNLRGKTLKTGLKRVLGDPELVNKVLDHPLVRIDLGRLLKRKPSYISPRNFALAFKSVIEITQPGSASATAKVKGADAPVDAAVAEQLKAITLSSELEVPGLKSVEKWFDESMDRVSGWYKRRAQLITVLLAALVAIGLNANALRIGEHLAEEPTLRSAVVAKAEAVAAKTKPEKTNDASELSAAGKNLETALDELEGLKLPVLWAADNVPHGSDWFTAIGGWLITIIAISLGAPFWFDALGKLSNLRLAGRRPEDKAKGSD